MLDVIYKPFAIGKAAQQQGLTAVRTFRLTLLDPSSKAVVAGKLTARRAHSWLLHILETDVALKEGQVLPVAISTLHSDYITIYAIQII